MDPGNVAAPEVRFGLPQKFKPPEAPPTERHALPPTERRTTRPPVYAGCGKSRD
jgi:hypothetical protein